MVEIIFTDEFGEWFDSLSGDEQGDIFDVVRKLEAKGVALGFRIAQRSRVQASPFANCGRGRAAVPYGRSTPSTRGGTRC
jgi:hypothetical protein